MWGNLQNRILDFTRGDSLSGASFFLDGGTGIDTLSIDLSYTGSDVVLTGAANPVEFSGVNLRPGNGAAVVNFERFGAVRTGFGDDRITQLGTVDNTFVTGLGEDIIAPGLGFDRVDGGLDLVGDSGYGFADDFATAAGDRLVLDYSGLGAGEVVRSSTALVSTNWFVGGNTLYTNEGRFEAFDPGNPNAITTSVDFTGIEGVTVTGSGGDDIIVGTNTVYGDLYGRTYADPTDVGYGNSRLPYTDNRGGDDVLAGGGGDDTLAGKTGDDLLLGGAGDDILTGSSLDPDGGFGIGSDRLEVDTLAGGGGADTFVLGDSDGSFYDDGGNQNYSSDNRAIITDFDAEEGDIVVLHADESYRVEIEGTTAFLYLDDGFSGYGEDELVAEIRDAPDFDLSADYVTFAGQGGAGGNAAGALPRAIAPATATQRTPAAVAQPAAPASAAAPAGPTWVAQTSDAAALKAAFEGDTPIAGTTLELEGAAEAFGTFDGDPFGLGSGIILSTGRVADLPGENTSSGPTSYAGDVPITFERVGFTNASTVYVANLAGLGIDIRSLVLADSGSREGGATGRFSGFDLDALVLSDVRLENVTAATNLNDTGLLPRRDVFDFTNAGVTLTPGEQRAGDFQSIDFNGTINGLLAGVTLDRFDSTGSTATEFNQSVTLGDFGSIAFDLTQPVSTRQPLYLYVAEAGISAEEQLVGVVSASTDTVVPTGDLSTDLSADGPNGDTTRLSYTFTPRSGDTAFSFDAVLFTEELPEYDGTDLTDLFSIKINGVEIGSLSDGSALGIKNLVYSPADDLIANTPGSGPLADAIKADAYTRTLRISGDLVQNTANTLTIEVRDGRDAFLDSGLLIKEGTFRTFVAPPRDGDDTGEPNTLPEIAAPSDPILVAENTTAVTTVAGSDADAGQTLTYSISGGADAGLFAINAATGALRFRSAPDFEAPADANGDNVYEVVVGVEDDGAGPGRALQDYRVQVTDVDETVVGPLLAFHLAKTSVTPGDSEATWRNPLTNLDYRQGAYTASSSSLTDRTGADLALFRARDGDTAITRAEFAGATAVDPAGNGPAITLDWTGTAAHLTLETAWDSIKNIRLDDFTGSKLTVKKFVNVAADWSDWTSDADLTLDGAKRSTIDFGSGDDTLLVLANSNNAGWDNVHDIGTGAGDDRVFIRASAVDYANETYGTTYDPSITLSRVDLGDGTDRFSGGVGSDTVDGGTGNDKMSGRRGSDALEGGDGNDVVRGAAGDDTLSGDDGDDHLYGHRGRDTLRGGAGEDRLSGGDRADLLFGGAGEDRIAGDQGHDVLKGEAGDDWLYGGLGKDWLFGGAGDDVLRGGAGSDSLKGGGGEDLYVLDGSCLIGGPDTIVTFVSGDDTIGISSSAFGLPDGALDPSRFQLGTAATGSDDTFLFDARTRTLFFDEDGADGAGPVALASFVTFDSLQASDIEIL
jgi:Ca2+-binding RTX toxin-like protein